MLWDALGDGSHGPAALRPRRITPARGRAADQVLVRCWNKAGGTQHRLRHCSLHQRCLVFGVKDVLAEVWMCPCLWEGVLAGARGGQGTLSRSSSQALPEGKGSGGQPRRGGTYGALAISRES